MTNLPLVFPHPASVCVAIVIVTSHFGHYWVESELDTRFKYYSQIPVAYHLNFVRVQRETQEQHNLEKEFSLFTGQAEENNRQSRGHTGRTRSGCLCFSPATSVGTPLVYRLWFFDELYLVGVN